MTAINIPKTHKALIYDKPGEISTKVVEIETPEPGAGEILVKVYAPSPSINYPRMQMGHAYPYIQDSFRNMPLRSKSDVQFGKKTPFHPQTEHTEQINSNNFPHSGHFSPSPSREAK